MQVKPPPIVLIISSNLKTPPKPEKELYLTLRKNLYSSQSTSNSMSNTSNDITPLKQGDNISYRTPFPAISRFSGSGANFYYKIQMNSIGFPKTLKLNCWINRPIFLLYKNLSSLKK